MSEPTHNSRSFDASHTVLAFPLGGIGTGNVSLGARGDLRDWEIFNRPAKGNTLPNTFFAIRTQVGQAAPVTRVLEGPLQPPYALSHGYHPASTAGLPRCAETAFVGEYPLSQIEFRDPQLPVQVRLEAYTPLVPLNPEDSGIPCAILTYHVTNVAQDPVAITLVGSLTNPIGGVRFDPYMNIEPNSVGQPRNEFRADDALRGLFFTADGIEPGDLPYGNMSLVTGHPNVTVKPAWLRGEWWDFLQDFWDDFVDDGLLDDLHYQNPPENSKPDTGSLGLVDTLAPGEEKSYQFLLTWYFPNRRNTWRRDNPAPVVRNHYATRFGDAWDVATYVAANFDRLDSETRRFHAALFGSTLPYSVLDALSANIVPVRSNTCFWLEDGRFYGWEGCFDDAGCCAGTCTHVWSYVYTVAYLFPSLEREMRRIEFEIETEADGYMSIRNLKSMGDRLIWTSVEQRPEAAVDGQMGSVLRAYREWQLCGDRAWLATIWPGIKRAMAYADEQWDKDHDGVLDGKQHNTYDIEFHGANPLSSIYYLAALRASERMALILGEDSLAAHYRDVAERGSRRLDELAWNGDYYSQMLEDVDAFKYQHGEGCLSDQLLGQLHACLLGLGDVLPREHIRQAIKAVYDHNFRTGFSDHVNCQRTYALNDESGLVMCTWPRGGRPRLPFVYSDEVWTGVEYHVAAHLLVEGWVDEGLRLVEAIRDRHDGKRRNPWNEVECGHHYARSMSSWMLLLALSGFRCDPDRKTLNFAPVMDASTVQDRFSTFWSNGLAWGTYTQQRDAGGAWRYDLQVLGGDGTGLQVSTDGRMA